MPNYNVMDLAKRLSALERKILSTKQPTLNRSAIDGGAIQGMDDEGSLRTVIGEQFDGTHTVSVVTGPTPPTPTAPLLTPALGTVRTYWDGTFADGSMSPMDFRRVTVHAAPSKDFTGFDPTDQSTIIGTISTATGGEVTSALASGQEYVVQLFAWSQAGKFSQGSMAATVTPEGVDTAEIEAALAEQAKLLEANRAAAEKLVADAKTELEAAAVTSDRIVADSSFADKVSGVIGTFKDAFSGSITTEMLNVTGSGKFSELVVSGMATFPSVWAGKIRGDYLSFDEGFFQKLKAGVAEFKSVTAGMITTNEIAAGAITSGKIAANAIDGKVMQGGDIYSPAKLLYPQVHVGGGVVEVIRNTPDDGPVTTISLGGLTDSVQIIDPATGTTLSSLNPDGTISSKGVSVDGDVVIRGRSIAGLVDAVDRAPQGIVAAYNLPGNSLRAGNTPLGIAEVNWVAQAGRMYRIVWDGYLNAPANNRVQLLFRMKIGTLERGASAPGVNDDSTIPASGIYSAPNAGLYRSHLEAVYRGLPGADYQARVLLVMMNLSSNSPVYASGYGSTIYVEDMGIGSFSGGYSASGGGTPYAASSADTTTVAPVAPPRTYTTTWGATWMTSLRTDGAAVSDALQQGYYAPNYRRSAIGFNTGPSSAGSIYKALAGASIQKVELYLKNSTFYSSSGGNANVDMSTLSTAPSSIGAITGRGLARNFKFAVGEGKWVTLNSDTWAGLKDGSTRSVVLGTTAGAADYARFSKADPPKIRITYVR